MESEGKSRFLLLKERFPLVRFVTIAELYAQLEGPKNNIAER